MIEYSKPSQIELFPSESGASFSMGKSYSPFRALTISPENIVIALIVLVMIFVLAFSFGVERGRKIVSINPAPEKINLETKEQDVIITPPVASEKVLKIKPLKDDIVVSRGKVQPKKDAVAVLPQEKQIASGRYTIQVASFKLKDYADKEAKQLQKLGHEIFVLSKGTYSVVCVGKFEQKEQADKVSRKLKSRYRDLVIRRM